MWMVREADKQNPPASPLYYDIFFASHLGTAVVSAHVQTHTNPTHAHHAYTNKPTTILRSLDRILCEITGSNHKPVGDETRRIPFVAPRERQQNLFRDEPR